MQSLPAPGFLFWGRLLSILQAGLSQFISGATTLLLAVVRSHKAPGQKLLPVPRFDLWPKQGGSLSHGPWQQKDPGTDAWGPLGRLAQPRVLRHQRLSSSPRMQALLRRRQLNPEGPSLKLIRKGKSIFRGAAPVRLGIRVQKPSWKRLGSSVCLFPSLCFSRCPSSVDLICP